MRLIDADAVMETLNIFNGGNPHFLNGIETAKEIITAAPTIEAEPVRRAHWVHKSGVNREWLECPICGRAEHSNYEYEYCPKCGTRMEVDECD